MNKLKKFKQRIKKESEIILNQKDGRDNSIQRNLILENTKTKHLTISLEIAKRPDIPCQHKILFGVIEQYESIEGCELSNKKLGELTGKSEIRIKQLLSDLCKNNMIIIKNKQSKYRKILINRKLNYNQKWRLLKTINNYKPLSSQVADNNDKKYCITGLYSNPLFCDTYNTTYYIYPKTSGKPDGSKETIFTRNDGRGRKIPSQEKQNFPVKEKIHPIIEYWNSLKNTRKHFNSQTKVYRDSVRRINQLKAGNFAYSNKSLKNFCKTRNLPVSLTRKKWTEKEIREVLQDISSLNGKKYALNEILCSPHHPTGLTSLFLFVASGKAENMREIEDPNPEITNHLRRILSDKSPGKNELQRLYKITNEIIRYQKWIYDYCKSFDDTKGGDDKLIRFFVSEIKDPVFIAKVYADWWEERFEEIEDWTITTNALGPNSKTWNLFIDDWMDDLHPNCGIQIRGYNG